MSYSLRPYQQECADFVLERLKNYKEPLLLNLSMAAGKCFAPETPVLMADGTIKPIKNIQVGEQVQSIDGANTVIATHGGVAKRYKICPTYNDPFIVSQDHIMYCYNIRTDEYETLTIEELVKKYRYANGCVGEYRLVHSPIKQYATKNLAIPPYILGLWLGDGTACRGYSITSADDVVARAWQEFGKNNGLVMRKYQKKNLKLGRLAKSFTYDIVREKYNPRTKNPIDVLFEQYNLLNNKHIPLDFLTSDWRQRSELLAGLIDTDGYFGQSGNCEIVQKHKLLAMQIAQLARGLGFAAHVTPKYVKWHDGRELVYWRVLMRGGADWKNLPLQVKTPTYAKRQRDYSIECFKIEPISDGEYFGIQVDNDNLFLLADNTIVHNTWIISEIAKKSGMKTLILTISKELCEQDYEKLSIVTGGKEIGMYSASWGRKETEPITVATVQSAYRHPELWEDYPLIIFDECDSGASLDGTLSELVKGKMVVGLSATCYGTVGSRKGRWYTTKLWAMHKIRSKTHGWFWKPVAYNISENDLYKAGYLCPIKYFCTPTECQLLKMTSNGSEFTVGSLNEWCNRIYKRALEVMVGAEKHGMCHCGIVFLPTVESCIALEKLCQEVGIDARAVHYKTPPKVRDELIQKHKDGELLWLINQGVLVRGFDNPRVDCMLCLRPTASLKLWRQCLSEDTEILTAEGWRKIGEIQVGDKLPNFNINTQRGDWDEVLDVIERPTDTAEQWVEYPGQSHNFKVTDGHNLLFRKPHQSKYYFQQAGKIESSFCVPTTVQLHKKGVFVDDFWDGKRLATSTEMWLVGMLLTDGHWLTSKDGKVNQVRIAQSAQYPYILDKIHQACKECNIKYRKRQVGAVGDERFIFGQKTQRNHDMFEYSLPKVDVEYLTPLLDKTAKWVKDATREQLLGLLDGLFDGNGAKRLSVTEYTIHTYDFCHPNKELIDNVNAACVTNNIQSHVKVTKKPHPSQPIYRLYYCPTKNCRSIIPPSKTEITTDTKKHRWLTKTPCAGEKCWCVETKNGTIITRRNGYVTVMGNCLGRLLRTHPDKKIAYCFDLTENTKNWGRVEDLVMGKTKVNGYEQDTILLRGKDINGMEISTINLANVRRRKIVDSTNDIRRNNEF